VIVQIRGSFVPDLAAIKREDILGQVLLVPSKIDRRLREVLDWRTQDIQSGDNITAKAAHRATCYSYVSNFQEPLLSIRQANSKSSVWITKQATLGSIRVVCLEIYLSRVSELIRPVIEEIESVPGNDARPTIG
jgi:hypothetical protein